MLLISMIGCMPLEVNDLPSTADYSEGSLIQDPTNENLQEVPEEEIVVVTEESDPEDIPITEDKPQAEIPTPTVPKAEVPQSETPKAETPTPVAQEPTVIEPAGSLNKEEALLNFNLVNEARLQAGQSALVWSEELYQVAAVRAKEITQLFSHTRPDGSEWYTASNLARGENLAYGYSMAQAVFDGFMSSEGHKANILRDWFATAGIAVFYGADGVAYWAQIYGE